MGKRLKLRAAPAAHISQDFRIDRAGAVIRDVVAMQAGIEALGHGVQADLKTLHMMAELGNARGARGIKQHFGHIGISENAMGKQIAIARNFRVDGDKLRHDMHMLPPARLSPVFARDPLEFLFSMAEDHPQDFGESVVVDTEFVWVLDDGREVPQREGSGERYTDGDDVERDVDGRPLRATTPLPVMRPTAFYYVDVVVDGALTHDGLFGADAVLAEMFSGTPSAYVQDVFEIVDRWREDYNVPLQDVPRKVNQVVSAYLFARGYQEETDMSLLNRRKKLDADQSAPAQPPTDEHEPVAEVEAVGEDAPEAVEDELDAALTTADETERRHEEDKAAEAEAEAEAEVAAVEALNARVETLEQLVAEQAATIAKLTRLTVQNTRNIDVLDRNVRRIDGEPVVKASVPATRPAALEELLGSTQQFSAPVPPAGARTAYPQAPTINRGMRDVDFEVDPELATFAIMAERQKALHGS